VADRNARLDPGLRGVIAVVPLPSGEGIPETDEERTA
jgi:hypothetical protein